MYFALAGSSHQSEGEGEGPSQLENILISILVMLLLTATLEYFTVTPEVSFSFFQQHMLSTGEVCIYLESLRISLAWRLWEGRLKNYTEIKDQNLLRDSAVEYFRVDENALSVHRFPIWR